ncbi:MAG: PRC-barrel domain-containing protein [Candidatus Methylomirabilales bacterium]
MTMRKLATACAVASLFVASAALEAVAQQQGERSQQMERSQSRDADRGAKRDEGDKPFSKGLKPGTVKASDLIGKNVEGRNGDNFGEIKDLLIDRDAQRVAYAVFDPDDALFADRAARTERAPGAPGPGAPGAPGAPPAGQGPAARTDEYRDRYLFVPLSVFSVSGNKLVMAADRDKIRQAPSFAKDKWPKMGDTGWREEVDKFYASAPAPGGQAGTQAGKDRLVRASEFLKKDVRNPQNERLGDVQDIVIEMNSGRVLYAVMAAGGFLGIGEKLFAIPVSAFNLATDGKELVLAADKERLKNAEGFDKNQWPATASRGWSERGRSGQQSPQGQRPQRQPQGQGQPGRSS